MELHGLLNACDALFASFPRTLEKGPWEGQLIPQEIGTVWASLGLGEAWWNGETIVWGLWPRWIGTVLDVWDLLLFFSDLVLLGADAFSIFFPSRYIPFIPVPLFSHPIPILFHPFPILVHPQYSVGLQDLPRERLQDRLENDGSQVDLLFFFQRHRVDTGWTPGGHYAVRVDTTTPYESIQVEP